ncbi:MAG TPA: histidinol-phosphatase HisJ family protein [Syntrophomonas sp.]|nr:histidinol-phosphatase HisJ family protein [Syntrophomonas sp.]
MMLVDYHVHALAHGEYKGDREWLSAFVEKACNIGIVEMGFSEHDEFMAGLDPAVFQQVQGDYRQDIKLRLGIEIDYIPGKEAELAHMISQVDYDYTIGSVHFIDGWAFDHPDYKELFGNRDIDAIYGRYAQILMQMADSRLFDIAGHIDLVKIWGHRPRQRKAADYFRPVFAKIKQAGMTVEINSAGLRKPVGEIYPADELLSILYEMNIPITLGSDAHHPDQMGAGLAEAREAAIKAGYKNITVFDQRRSSSIPIQ